LDVHLLTQEDIVSPGQRAKVEEFDGHAFVVARMVRYEPDVARLESEQVSLIVTDRVVISFQERTGDVFGPVRARLRAASGRIRERGGDYLAFALLDILVDHVFLVLETIGDEIEDLESEVVDDPSPKIQHRLRGLRTNLILLRRAIWPVRELLSTLARGDSAVFRPETQLFLRDAQDHAIQAVEVIESLREIVGGLADLYLSSLSHRMNDVMKVLTIIGTIFIPLSFVAGLYGMNFDSMPELHWQYGYPMALGLMGTVAGGLLIYFRVKKWI
jgi:magnesium transporter